MNVAFRGLLSTGVRAAVDAYVDGHMYGGWDKQQELAMIERTRESLARLINAENDEIAITKNVSEGLNAIAAALPWEPGDNVVFCPELEHPNNVYPWLNLERRIGVEVRTVEPEDGRLPSDKMAAAMDEHTRLVTVPTVSFSPGFITDLAPIGQACRELGTFFLVDAAQSVGVEHTDVEALDVDGLAVASQKGLLAFYGTGFLYCRRSWAERLQPAYLTRFGVALGADAHETAMDREKLEYASAARRFDLGNYNYLGAAASEASLRLIHQLGTKRIERYVRSLAHRLATGMLELGLPVAGGPPGPHIGHIVAVGISGGGRHYTADDPRMNDLYRCLTDNGVKLSIRRGVLRFSLHFYNNSDDVDRVLELTRRWLEPQ
ncbi:MAG: aminotransferase class V-fold PLP-dependent enzyme [Gemmatimonadota bacterium]|nr:MAG: aminotransferase class V-fold PLP-dependent enzyme [Gemmatimonadota bacterium]